MVNYIFRSTRSWRYLVLIILLFLTACAHVTKQDGPPNFYVDASKVPDAVPKVEPLSKFGNQNPYYVFGKPYHVLKSSKFYDAVGVASWYGTKFNSRHTSSGERYNMLTMTAAHKSLPLPTYALVTNLRNHRKVIVKVNDRGPFEAHRLIDLSYVAAKKLGMLGRGTTLVRVQAIDPVAYWNPAHLYALNNPIRHYFNTHHYAVNKALTHSMHFVYLQVGAFRNKHYAERLKQKITTIISSQVNITNSAKLYRVRIGPFKDTMTAGKISAQLKTLGIASNRLEM